MGLKACCEHTSLSYKRSLGRIFHLTLQARIGGSKKDLLEGWIRAYEHATADVTSFMVFLITCLRRSAGRQVEACVFKQNPPGRRN